MAAADADHLLLTEVRVGPDTGEFIEIFNPTSSTIALDNYYLADDQDYILMPGFDGASPAPNIGVADFLVRFPAGSSIAPGEVIVIALRGNGFFAEFGFRANFEIRPFDTETPDMVWPVPSTAPTLTDGGECMCLFKWDGISDLVHDVDLLRWGSPVSVQDLPNKTGFAVDGPDEGREPSVFLPDAFTMPVPGSFPSNAQSLNRIALEGEHELAAGGNGLTGHDETSENILATWDFGTFAAPNPGVILFEMTSPQPDLFITLDGPRTAPEGSVVQLSLTISNVGEAQADVVVVSTQLPGEVDFSFQSCDPPAWKFEQNGSELAWSAPAMAQQEEASITLATTLKPGARGQVEFTVSVSAESDEAEMKNNIASLTIDIEPIAACKGDFVSNITFQPPPDGIVDAADLAYLLGDWGTINPDSPADMVTSSTFAPPPDGIVDAADLATLLGAWGACP